MRAYVLAATLAALAQPAIARDHVRSTSHHAERHHQHQAAYSHRHHQRVRHRQAPFSNQWGYQQDEAREIFMRTDAANAFAWQRSTQWQQPDWQQPRVSRRATQASHSELDSMIARHAAANGLPVELVHRVVRRESNYNPRASSKGNIGLMQIRHATARGIGYSGSVAGLLDPETNLTYAVRYLAGAYQAAGGNANRAVAYYASGYHGRGLRQLPQQTAAWQNSAPVWQSSPVAMPYGDTADRPRYRHREHRR